MQNHKGSECHKSSLTWHIPFWSIPLSTKVFTVFKFRWLPMIRVLNICKQIFPSISNTQLPTNHLFIAISVFLFWTLGMFFCISTRLKSRWSSCSSTTKYPCRLPRGGDRRNKKISGRKYIKKLCFNMLKTPFKKVPLPIWRRCVSYDCVQHPNG